MKKLKVLSIIPARSGSKRIPRKNIKPFLGKPIIFYPIRAAISSNLFDEVMVSTDDHEIARIAEKFGAKIPFYRSKKNADDFSTIGDVAIEVLSEYQKHGKVFDVFCMILPTAPFVDNRHLVSSYELMSKSKSDSVVSVVEYEYSIWRAMEIRKNKLKMIWPENYPKRSQDLIDSYHDAGLFYWCRTKVFQKEKIFFGSNTIPYILPKTSVQDIDDEEDWKLAEAKYRLIKDK